MNNSYQDPPCTLKYGYMVPKGRHLGLKQRIVAGCRYIGP